MDFGTLDRQMLDNSQCRHKLIWPEVLQLPYLNFNSEKSNIWELYDYGTHICKKFFRNRTNLPTFARCQFMAKTLNQTTYKSSSLCVVKCSVCIQELKKMKRNISVP